MEDNDPRKGCEKLNKIGGCVTDKPRLIEVAFPLKQASLDSVHEKNVRHGHISTLHIWPARRPLAACRAALIATLLPDPGNLEERNKILEKMGGQVVKVVKKKKLPSGKIEKKETEETIGGILHWGRESGPDLEWFRQKIKEAYGGRPPRVLDPFAGGGAIPLEAMRLGCEVTAIDINPVAWFILKCTLEYPQRLAGQKRPLPSFVLNGKDFMEAFFKSQGFKGAMLRTCLERIGMGEGNEQLFSSIGLDLGTLEADLAWHVRAWGWWVLSQAKKDLERFYPTIGGKPTVAYLWARTVICKSCRATIPLLKTRWLCKKDKKRVVLTMKPNPEKTGVIFGIWNEVPVEGKNAAQRREHDKKIGAGTMSRSGATCPCCQTIMTMEDIRLEGRAGRLGSVMTAVVVDGTNGKEYRLPVEEEIRAAKEAENELERVFSKIPFGLPDEPTPKGGSGASRAFSVDGYGMDKWYKLFTPRQLLALGTFVKYTRAAREAMQKFGYSQEWAETVTALLACVFSRTADYMANLCVWEHGAEEVKHAFMRWALPITWDFGEANPFAPIERFYVGGLNSAFRVASTVCSFSFVHSRKPEVHLRSAIVGADDFSDVIFTDPPYYDAIPYSDLMDFFYVWLRRTLQGLSPEIDSALCSPLSPKWDHNENDGELIDDASRHSDNLSASKKAYEDGMYRAFSASHKKLEANGRLAVVFANKSPEAWETLVASIIRAGFCVTSSWPIATEMPGGLRNLNRASLASSVWLVCKKRPGNATPGWDNKVLEEMRANIAVRLREFWDAGIRGPDFVWAATGPALEAYSKHPVVKKANDPGEVMTVSEFLRHVRRIVVDFVVGRVLSHNGGDETTSGLDDVTTYYLLHRNDFGLEEAPIGACILYAISCGLSDTALSDQYDILVRTGGKGETEEEEEEIAPEEKDEGEAESGSGSRVKLRQWHQRKRKGLGYDAPGGKGIPYIDQVHRLMHLWKGGDVTEVDEYLNSKGLRRNTLFHQLLQALIELAPAGSEERSVLESLSNHVAGRGVSAEKKQMELPT